MHHPQEKHTKNQKLQKVVCIFFLLLHKKEHKTNIIYFFVYICIIKYYQKRTTTMDCKLTFFSITPALYTLPAFVRKFTNNSCKNNHVFIHTEKTLNKINMKNLLIILFACFMAGQVYGQEISDAAYYAN